MPIAQDVTGQKWGKLTAVKFTGTYAISSGGNKKRLWLFDCDCGKQHIAPLEKVKSGDTRSCGCNRGFYKGRDALLNAVFCWGKSKQGLIGKHKRVNCYSDGDLTFEQFKELCQYDCHYCGKAPSSYITDRISGNKVFYSGLDRMDNNLPHNFANCVPCCHQCNTTKGSRSYQEFIDYLKNTLKRLGY